jgi:hypothetical protein
MWLHMSCHKSVKAVVSIHPFVTAAAGAPGMVVWTSLLSAFREGEGDEDKEFAASFKPLPGCLRVIPRRFISSPSILIDGVRYLPVFWRQNFGECALSARRARVVVLHVW